MIVVNRSLLSFDCNAAHFCVYRFSTIVERLFDCAHFREYLGELFAVLVEFSDSRTKEVSELLHARVVRPAVQALRTRRVAMFTFHDGTVIGRGSWFRIHLER